MRKIIWETQFLEFKKDDSFGYRETDDDDDSDESEPEDGEQIEIENLISTPFGVFNMNNKYNPYYTYKFYMGHTNFDITQEVSDIIEKTQGIEVLKVISRYRFLIAVGKAFDPVEVRKNINDEFCPINTENEEILLLINSIEDEDYRDYVMELVASIDMEYSKWALSTIQEPEFSCEFIGFKEGDDEEKYLEDFENFKEKHRNDGIFLEKT